MGRFLGFEKEQPFKTQRRVGVGEGARGGSTGWREAPPVKQAAGVEDPHAGRI
jgi:hypothetical protein